LTQDLSDYLGTHSAPQDTQQFREASDIIIFGGVRLMQISQDEGALLSMLVHISGAKNVVEVGTFLGYSAICLARALPADGRVLTCDISEDWTTLARLRWQAAELQDKIDLRIGPALDTIRSLPDTETIDFSFIDADKLNYRAYYEELLPRTRRGGLIVLDDVLWWHGVLDGENTDPTVKSFRELNDLLATDTRIESVMLGVRNGLTICRKL